MGVTGNSIGRIEIESNGNQVLQTYDHTVIGNLLMRASVCLVFRDFQMGLVRISFAKKNCEKEIFSNCKLKSIFKHHKSHSLHATTLILCLLIFYTVLAHSCTRFPCYLGMQRPNEQQQRLSSWAIN